MRAFLFCIFLIANLVGFSQVAVPNTFTKKFNVGNYYYPVESYSFQSKEMGLIFQKPAIDTSLFVRLNEFGDTILTKRFTIYPDTADLTTPKGHIRDIHQLADGGYFFYGVLNSTSIAYYGVINADGTIRFTKRLYASGGTIQHSSFMHTVQKSNGNIVFRIALNTAGYNGLTALVCVDENTGAIVWNSDVIRTGMTSSSVQHNVNPDASSSIIEVDESDNIYILNQNGMVQGFWNGIYHNNLKIKLLKFSPTGNIIWNKVKINDALGKYQTDQFALSMYLKSDSIFIVSRNRANYNDYYISLLDTSGTLLDTLGFNIPSGDSYNGINESWGRSCNSIIVNNKLITNYYGTTSTSYTIYDIATNTIDTIIADPSGTRRSYLPSLNKQPTDNFNYLVARSSDGTNYEYQKFTPTFLLDSFGSCEPNVVRPVVTNSEIPYDESWEDDSLIIAPVTFTQQDINAQVFNATVSSLCNEILNVGNDTNVACGTDSIQLSINITGTDSVIWSTGETSPSIYVDSTDTYYVTVYKACCFYVDSIHVQFNLDAVNPTITCKDSLVYLDSNGIASIDTSYVITSFGDNCSVDTLWLSQTSYNCSNLGINSVTTYILDNAGNIDSCQSQIAVLDSIIPFIQCKDTTVYLDSNGVFVIDTSFVFDSAWDNCGILSVQLLDSSFNCANLGLNSVRIEVVDNFNNRDTCIAQVTVMDSILPVIVCHDTLVFLDSNGQFVFDTSFILTSFMDNCGVDSVWMSDTAAMCGIDTVITTIYIRDLAGNIDSCTSNVYVLDTIKPMINCSNSFVYTDSAGNYSFDTSFFAISYSDNCGVEAVWIEVTDSNTCADSLVLTVNCFAIDSSGNENYCTSYIVVRDTTPIQVFCMDTVVYLNSSGVATIDTSYVLDSIQQFNDSITYVKLSIRAYLSGAFTSSAPPMRDDIRAAGLLPLTEPYNSIPKYAYVKGGDVVDTSLFIVTGSDAIVDWVLVELIDPIDSMEVVATRSVLLQSDGDIVDTNGLSEITFPNVKPGNYLVKIAHRNHLDVLTANAYALDTATTTLDFTNGTVSTYGADGLRNISGVDALWSGDANSNGKLRYLGYNNDAAKILYDVLNHPGNITGAYNFVANGYFLSDLDLNGIAKYQGPTNDINIIFSSVLLHPQNSGFSTSFIFNEQTKGSKQVVYQGVKQNCVQNVWLSQSSFNCSDIGTNQVTIYVEDQSGNIDSCVSNVTVIDTTGPVALCQNMNAFLDASGNVLIDSNYTDAGSYDNCLIDSMYTLPNAFTCANLGSNNVMLYVRDNQGYWDSCSSIVTVLDTISPVANCRDTLIYLVGGVATIDSSFVNNGSTDNCGVATISLSQSNFTCIDAGVNTITITVTDFSGNMSTCQSNVTVVDSIKPVAQCQDTIVYLDAFGLATIDSAMIDNGSSDNCGYSVSFSQNTFNCADTGLNNVWLYATDLYGNIDSCMSIVTVLDTTKPIVQCQNINVYLDAVGQATISVVDIDNGTSDNCGLSSLTISQSNFNCNDIGANSVTLIATDQSGNIDSCVATVTVLDTILPIVNCPGNIDTTIIDINCYFTIGDYTGLVSVSDNCNASTFSISQNPAPWTVINGFNGLVPVQIIVNDGLGNIDSCSFNLTVNCDPTLLVPQFISPNDDGLNDSWDMPELLNYPLNKVQIFNRWGNLVFEKDGYSSGWKGKANVTKPPVIGDGNGDLPSGTYFYIIDLGNGFDKITGYLQIRQ